MSRPRANGAFTSRELLDQIADKWTALILGALCPAPLRFNALKRELRGVTQTALTATLRRLEHNGIVRRQIIADRPVAVEYSITPLGRSLEPIFGAMDDWTKNHFEEVETARAAFVEQANLLPPEPFNHPSENAAAQSR